MSYHGDLISGKLPNFEISRFGTQNLEISRFDMQNLVFAAKSWEKKYGLVTNLPRYKHQTEVDKKSVMAAGSVSKFSFSF